MAKVALAAALLLVLLVASSTVEACDSSSTLSSIHSCAPAVAVGSGNGKASDECCTELRGVGRECLCDLLQGPIPDGVNLTLAQQIAAQCGFAGATC